jgi:hypothetical protein
VFAPAPLNTMPRPVGAPARERVHISVLFDRQRMLVVSCDFCTTPIKAVFLQV